MIIRNIVNTMNKYTKKQVKTLTWTSLAIVRGVRGLPTTTITFRSFHCFTCARAPHKRGTISFRRRPIVDSLMLLQLHAVDSRWHASRRSSLPSTAAPSKVNICDLSDSVGLACYGKRRERGAMILFCFS